MMTDCSAASDGFFYHAKPSDLGFYCIYTHRPGQAGIVPDCPNVANTLKTHASQLTSAGVNYVVMDGTNLPTMSTEAGTALSLELYLSMTGAGNERIVVECHRRCYSSAANRSHF